MKTGIDCEDTRLLYLAGNTLEEACMFGGKLYAFTVLIWFGLIISAAGWAMLLLTSGDKLQAISGSTILTGHALSLLGAILYGAFLIAEMLHHHPRIAEEAAARAVARQRLGQR